MHISNRLIRNNRKNVAFVSPRFAGYFGKRIFFKFAISCDFTKAESQKSWFSRKNSILKIEENFFRKNFGAIKCSISRAIFLKKRFWKKLLYNSRKLIFSKFGRKIIKILDFTKNSNFWLKKMNFWEIFLCKLREKIWVKFWYQTFGV